MIIKSNTPTRFLEAIQPPVDQEPPSRVNAEQTQVVDNDVGLDTNHLHEEYDPLCSPLHNDFQESFSRLTNGIQKKHHWKILKIAQLFPRDQLSTISQITAPFLKDVKDVAQRSKILSMLSKISVSDQIPFILDIKPFLEQLKSFQDKCHLINGVERLPPDKRRIFLKQAFPFTSGKDSSILQVELIDKLQEFKTDVNEEVLTLAKHLMHSDMDLKDRITLIQGVHLLPQEHRQRFCATTCSLLNEVDSSNQSDLLQAILNDSCLNTLKKFDHLSFFKEHIQTTEKGKFYLLLLKAPADKLEAICSILTPFFHLEGALDPVYFIKMLLQYKTLDLQAFCQWLQPRSQPQTLVEISSYLNNIRPRFMEGVDYLLKIDEHPLFGQLHLSFFQEYLNEHEQNLEDVLEVAYFILDQHVSLGIDEESPLFSKALQITQLNEITQQNVLNPYRIYSEHQQLAKAPPFIPPIPIAGSKDKIFFLPSEGLEKMRQTLVSSAQLPSTIAPSYFTDKVGILATRLDELSSKDKQSLLDEIHTLTGLNFSQLKANLTDPFFELTLSTSKKNQHQVPSYVVKLFQIILWLETLERESSSPGALSLFDRALMEISACINNCSEGKKFGISQAYRYLPQQFQKRHKGEFLEAPLDNFLEACLSPYFEKGLENHNWIKELLRPKVFHKVSELPHHVLYVKNRIARFLGLSHTVQFDPFTGVLIKKILQYTPQELLKRFFSQFSTEDLLHTLVQGYKGLDAKEKNALFHALNGLSEGKELIEFWDEENDWSLTEKGALQILLASKLFSCP